MNFERCLKQLQREKEACPTSLLDASLPIRVWVQHICNSFSGEVKYSEKMLYSGGFWHMQPVGYNVYKYKLRKAGPS